MPRTLENNPAIWLALLALSFAGGCAALIYQVVWFQLLELVIGASAVSLGVLLATFMGGLGIGGLLLWRVVSARRHPLAVLACLELGTGAMGLALLFLMPVIGTFYAASVAGGVPDLTLRAAVAALALLPPTVLMGATLPAIARFVKTTPRGVSRVGYLYAVNIAGAVAGSLLAGFYLLRVHDVTVATYTAAGVNAAAGLGSLALAALTLYAAPVVRGQAHAAHWERAAQPKRAAQAARTAAVGTAEPAPPAQADARERLELRPGAWPVYVAIALSGLTALAAEVIWTRHLSLLLGGTVYTFALILAVFLLGLGLGSAAGTALLRRMRPEVGLGVCQLLLCAAIVWAAYAIARSLPYWPLDVTLPVAPWIALQLDLIRVGWAILPAALLWGASFPFAVAAVAADEHDPARLVGGVYAANTLGAVVGASAAGFVLVAWLGSLLSQQLLIAISALSGLLVLITAAAPASAHGRHLPAAGPALTSPPARLAWVVAGAGAALILAWRTPALPGELIAFGRFVPTRAPHAEILYQAEGIASSIAVSRDANGRLTYHNAGKAQASSYPQDLRLQRMLGHLSTLVPERPESVLVIGLGAGITAGAVAIDPSVERVVVAEIEPLAAHAAAEYFSTHNFGVLDQPKVELRIDDGRHYLATTRDTFDAITSDPLDPWVKGAASLYTREFWQLVKSRLNPGGVVTAFLQLYENTEEAVKSEVATFFEVFENGAVFANTIQGTGYDAVLLARADGEPIDVDLVQARLGSAAYTLVAGSLAEVGFRSATDLLGTYSGSKSDLAHWFEGSEINRDRNLRLQYLAGEGLNVYLADEIFQNMVGQGIAFPEHLFTGSPRRLDELRNAIRAHHRGGF